MGEPKERSQTTLPEYLLWELSYRPEPRGHFMG